MEITSPTQLHDFLSKLGERCPFPAEIYLFGGSAVLLMGGARYTDDVDYTLNASAASTLRPMIEALADEMGLDLEESIPADFMPLPDGAEGRHVLIGRYARLTAYIFDPYSIAVMKIDRAFQTDMQDVRFLIHNGHIQLEVLEQYVADVARRYDEPIKLRKNFEEMKRGL